MRNFTVHEIATFMKTNPETVRRWIRSGELRASRMSRKKGWLVNEQDVVEFADSHPKYARRIGTDMPLPAVVEPLTEKELLRDRLAKLIKHRDNLNDRIRELETILGEP